MHDPVSDDTARARWLAIGAVRLAGVAMVVVGILGLRGVFAYPDIAAYILIGVGLFDAFFVPLVMARKWRSPRQ